MIDDACRSIDECWSLIWDNPRAPPGAVHDPGHTCWGVVHGAFVNRQEIRRALNDVQWIGQGSNDAQLLVAGYGKWGLVGLCQRLVGDFSLLIWDEEQRRLLAATDPFGSRPLFYAETPGRFSLGPRTAGLWSMPWISDTLDEQMVMAHLIRCPWNAQKTFYRQISRLPGGCYLVARRDILEVRRYWGPHFAGPTGVKTREDLLEHFRELFEQAVCQRLQLADSTAILMSGGFDSTAVAGVAGALWRQAGAARHAIKIFYAVYGDLPCDESSRIGRMLETLPFASRRFDGLHSAISLEAAQEDVQRHDTPFLNMQGPLFRDYVKAAGEEGIDVILTGVAGDTLAEDAEYHVDLIRSSGALGFAGAVRRISQIEGLSPGVVVLRLLRRICPEEVKRPYRWIRRRVTPRQQRFDDLLHPDHRPLVARLRRRPDVVTDRFLSHSQHERWRSINDPQAQKARAWWVREFDAAGLICCTPFQDRRLSELILGAPEGLLPRTYETAEYKPLITRGLGRYVPRELTSTSWKVIFDEYHRHVLDRSFSTIHNYLFRDSRWLAEPFVPRKNAEAAFERYAQALQKGHGSKAGHEEMGSWVRWLEDIAGLEIWLRARRAICR